jgi:hypothetical protein
MASTIVVDDKMTLDHRATQVSRHPTKGGYPGGARSEADLAIRELGGSQLRERVLGRVPEDVH